MRIAVPSTLQGVQTATVRRWLKAVGTTAAAGDVLVELETEDALIHLQAPADGTLAAIAAPVGKTVAPAEEIGRFETGAAAPAPAAASAAPAAVPAGVTPVLMPQAGNTMEEGTILKWRVQVGDRIAVGQIICDIETDKATIEMEAPDAGRLAKIVAAEGAVIPVKQPIAYLAEKNVDVSKLNGTPIPTAPTDAPATPAAAAPAVAAVVTPITRTPGERIKASPAARKLAAAKGLDLSTISAGSGPDGRILSTDLAALAANGNRKPLSKMRKAIAANLQASKQTVPHFYVKQTIDADPLMAFYRAQKPATGCTLNDVILLAVGKAIGEFPAFRSRIDGGDLVETPAAHVGIAVSVADGLVVPVVLNVDKMTLVELSKESKRIVEAARAGKIENMGKGVFTISNMGMLGVEEFAAIINPPESGILAVSAVREAPIAEGGAVRAGRVMTMTLSVDHRVVDGAEAAKFMQRLSQIMHSLGEIGA
jgi:pyruvate dehydrogenase E2 component (dihydrolipoamide acetyltransferase)